MKVYFVRHGESTGNVEGLHQDAFTPLSDKGIQQAKQVAKRFVNIPIDIILASTYKRASQTAEIINVVINKPIEFLDLLIERKRPSIIEGKPSNDEEAVKIRNLITENFHSPNFRHSDEETFLDIKTRASKAIEYIINLQKEHVVVVLHGDILRMILGVMAFKDALTPMNYLQLGRFYHFDNTGITVCERQPKRGWVLLTLNDLRHIEQA